MDLNTHLAKIVEGLVADITSNVLIRVDSAISAAINNRLAAYDYASHIQQAANAAFERRVSEYTVDPKRLENRIVGKINETIEAAQGQTKSLVESEVQQRLSTIDLQRAVTDSVSTIVADRLSEFVFPPNSIDPAALKLLDLKITGDNIRGGIIENFSSTGIDDRASQVALTILDDSTVVENNLLTKDLTVQGSMIINGEFVVNGAVPEDTEFFRKLVASTTTNTLTSLDHALFNNYSTLIFDKLKHNGLDLTKITLNGTEIASPGTLGSTIVNSNLQTLGELRELRVSGESLLAQTLYVTPRRVGINTIEPSAALSIWDDEIEIIAKKKSRDVGMLGTARHQKLVLTANGKDNIVLSDDGSAQIDHLKIGSMQFTTSNVPPNFVSERCHVVWNTNPNPGGPLGWVCLGGANWANFGIID
jgi:hypothetical protein